jgi:hypothetical protein
MTGPTITGLDFVEPSSTPSPAAYPQNSDGRNAMLNQDAAARGVIQIDLGPLLTKSPTEVGALLRKMWDDQDDIMAEPIARWTANRRRRKGMIGVHVIKPDKDRAEYKVWSPPGASKVPPTFNQAARLSRRLVAQLFADPPIPECTPGDASGNTEPDAAEFSTRILQDVMSTPVFNGVKTARRAVDRGCTYDSGFVRLYVDPKGGGHKPRQILASAQATTVADATHTQQPSAIDPTQMVEIPQPKPYTLRYVRPDQSLTDDPAEADLVWLAAVKPDIFTGRQGRFLPSTAKDIDEADGFMISTFRPLSEVKDTYAKELSALDNDGLWELVNYRPGKWKILVPSHMKDVKVPTKKADEPPPDDALVLVTCVYMRQGGSYPKGAYVCIAGKDKLAHRQEWTVVVNGVEEGLLIPVSQFKGFEEGEDDPYGFGLMHLLGPGNEVRAAALGNAIEHLDRFNRRKVFYTPNSLFQAKSGPAAMGVYVPVQQGTEPKAEDVPDYPTVGMEILDRATNEMTDESGLQLPAQGQTDPNVKSGLHAQTLIEQVSIGLSDIKQATEDGFVRMSRITLQLIRAFFTEPQMIRYRGEDQRYKYREWSSADLTDTKDVRILKGSFSMLAPTAKLAVAQFMYELKLIDDWQLKQMAGGNIGGNLGLQDDPALLRIRRQLEDFQQGPPKGSDPALWPQLLADIFKRFPNDMDQKNATFRYREIDKTMNGVKYERLDPNWRAGLEAEYEQMRYYAGVGTTDDANKVPPGTGPAQQGGAVPQAALTAGANTSQLEAGAQPTRPTLSSPSQQPVAA